LENQDVDRRILLHRNRTNVYRMWRDGPCQDRIQLGLL